MRYIAIKTIKSVYKTILKPLLFLIHPETVHHNAVLVGEFLGNYSTPKKLSRSILATKSPVLKQVIFGLEFQSPIGLSAGFDYEAKLTQVLPSLGFGFETVGTLTRQPYGGVKGSMLGRLPQSKSLMVNKGFKNLGIEQTLEYLKGKSYDYPLGISIGRTNTPDHRSQEEAVMDIVESFKIAEKSNVPFSFYELNISCPNLTGSIEFYESANLEHLLKEVGKLILTKPVFVKMPISKTDEEVRGMLDVIIRFPYIKAVIIGNLQRNRTARDFIQKEVEKFKVGNFSGKPCKTRSDELIKLVYKNYGSKIKIIGCGGVFSAMDAYKKIKLGSSLVGLITGLIYEGPQLIAEINAELPQLLKKDGFETIEEAVGTDV